MKKRLILIGILTCLCIALSAGAVLAVAVTQPGFELQPSSGPPGTLVTWTFETPIQNGQSGFLADEDGDILFCSQQIDVGDFSVPNFSRGGLGAQQYPTVTVMFTIPEEAPTGTCTARAHGRRSGFEVTADFEVTATTVPYTGGPPKKTLPSWIAYLVGGIMLAVGGAFVWRRTRIA